MSITLRLGGYHRAQNCLPGYQYAVFWTPSPANASVRHACVSRRDLKASSAWETFTLTDYDQTDDDGHNVYAHFSRPLLPLTLLPSISLGISPTDGTLHIGFDQHDNPLRYRVSTPGVATDPAHTAWAADIFGPTLVRPPLTAHS